MGVRVLEALIAESPMLEVLLPDDLWFPDNNGLEEPTLRRPNSET